MSVQQSTDVILSQVFENLPFPAWVIEIGGAILLSNASAEQLLKASSRAMRGKTMADYFGPNSLVVDTLSQAVREQGSITQYGVEIAPFGQELMSCNVNVNFLDPELQKVILIIQPTGVAQKMSQSITHLTAARSVSAMAATLAHEIRNPLAGISGAAQLLSMNANEDDSQLADMIGQEAKRIGALVDRVEHFGDQRPATRKAINIHDVLDRAVTAANAGYARDVSFVKEYDPSLPDAAGDFDQLLQVFQNLIKNAVEAIGAKNGAIRLRSSYNSGVKFAISGARTENLPLQIEIIDNGEGIAPELIDEIFEPFVSSKVDGTGLGLSLVSKIIAGHGGLIECKSSYGRTVFTIRLPIWKE